MSDIPLLGLSQRLPPSNYQAEQALLGALMANNLALRHVAGFLKPNHFADPVNGAIFDAIEGHVARGKLADPITLRAEFEHTGALDEVGGTSYLAQLMTAMVGIINAGDYGRAIQDAWIRRQLVDIGEEVVNRAFGADPEMDGAQQVAAATRRLMRLSNPERADRLDELDASRTPPEIDQAEVDRAANEARDPAEMFTDCEFVGGLAVEMQTARADEPSDRIAHARSCDVQAWESMAESSGLGIMPKDQIYGHMRSICRQAAECLRYVAGMDNVESNLLGRCQELVDDIAEVETYARRLGGERLYSVRVCDPDPKTGLVSVVVTDHAGGDAVYVSLHDAVENTDEAAERMLKRRRQAPSPTLDDTDTPF